VESRIDCLEAARTIWCVAISKRGGAPAIKLMESNSALLEKHLENDVGCQQLLNIERRLRDRPYPPQLVTQDHERIAEALRANTIRLVALV
jgi:hypothetical protein